MIRFHSIRASGLHQARRLMVDRSGNVAILFGLALLPLVGLVGIAIDYNRATELRTFIHRETDATALAIASSDTPNAPNSLAALKARVTDHYGTASGIISNVTMSDQWTGNSVYTLTTNADIATTLSAVLPAYPKAIPISVTTSVKRKPPAWTWSLPKIKDLSYEAADYNRISVYCYDETKKNEANKGRRLETLTAISDNAGTDYSKAKLPECKAGETLSYKLWNVRDSRAKPANWQNQGTKSPETDYSLRKSSVSYYGFYTDTTIDVNTRVMTNKVSGGKEVSSSSMTPVDLTNAPLVETIICTTDVDCKAKNQGGVLPNDNESNKNPATATGGCAENKSMYYGWEDRPPVAGGGSDRDYNDIRIVVSCPTLQKISDKEVRIIR